MKYVIWVLVFVAYVLCVAGLFRLMGRITAGVELEVQVEREVYGEVVTRTQSVPFNEAPVVRMTIGTAGIYIAVGLGFITADYISRAWDGDEEKKRSKRDKWMTVCIFTVLFVSLSFLFDVHTVDEFFGLMGWIFMALTCALTIIISAFLSRMLSGRKEAAKASGSEVL